MAFGLDEGDTAAFGQPVALRHRAANDVEEAQRFRRDRRAGAEAVTAAGEAEMTLDIAEQQDVQQRVAEAIEPGRGPGLPAVRQLAAPGKAGLDEALAQRPAFAELEQKTLLELFVNAGDADEERRCDLADVEGYGIDRFRKADSAAKHQMRHLAIAALGNMTQRQIAHGLEGLVSDPDGFGVDVGGIDQVTMGQHRALGRPGRARRIDQDGDVIRRGLRNQTIQRRVGVGVFERIGPAALAQRFERYQLRLPVLPEAFHVDANDGLERRQAVIVGQRIQHLVGLFLIASYHHPRAGVAHDILQLDPGIGRVDADRDRTDHLDAEIGVKPFRRVLAGDGDAVARLEAEGDQAERHRTRRLVIMAPGIGIPDAVFLLPQRELVAMHRGALAEQLGNGDRGVLQRDPQRSGVGYGRRPCQTRLDRRMFGAQALECRHHAPTPAAASAR
jgi:hypothetical protein